MGCAEKGNLARDCCVFVKIEKLSFVDILAKMLDNIAALLNVMDEGK